MITILLVEDEPLMREAIQSMLDWQQYGFQVAATARNGSEALKMLKSQSFDLVLTDIKMPVMDGIELLQRAKDYMHHTAFIMLSSYDEFKLVSSAYKLGAKDYILKSEITEEQVISVLQRVSQDLFALRQEHEQRAGHDQILKVFSDNVTILRRRRLEDILEGRTTLHQVSQAGQDSLGLKINGERIAVVNLSLRGRLIHRPSDDLQASQLQRQLTGHLEHLLEQVPAANLLPRSIDQYVLLFSFSAHDSSADIKAHLRQIYLDIKQSMEKIFDIRVCGGTGNIGQAIESAPALLQQAMTASLQCFVQGSDRLIHFSEVASLVSAEEPEWTDKGKQLKTLLASMDSDIIRQAPAQFTFEPKPVTAAGIDRIRRICEAYSHIIEEAAEAHMLEQELIPVINAYRDLAQDADLHQLNDWLTWAIRSYAIAIDQGNSIINRAKQIIHKHYGSHLTLTELAENIGVNSSYLSRLFNKTVGCTFMDYLSRVRMDASLELFRQGNLKIYEVAEKVGYANPEHFSRVFKKYFHKSPKDFLS